jgi:transposase
MLATVGCQAVCGERVILDPVGGVAGRDGKPDLTLAEIVQRLWQDRQVRTTDSSVDRFFRRHGVSFKKNSARRRAGAA